ncbi:unnamed protein product [Musa textilis]
MVLGQRKRNPCPCSSCSTVVVASSSTLNGSCLCMTMGWRKEKGVGCILIMNVGLDFSLYTEEAARNHLTAVMFSSLIKFLS